MIRAPQHNVPYLSFDTTMRVDRLRRFVVNDVGALLNLEFGSQSIQHLDSIVRSEWRTAPVRTRTRCLAKPLSCVPERWYLASDRLFSRLRSGSEPGSKLEDIKTCQKP